MDLLVLSKSCWPGNGVSTICGTTILHSGTVCSLIHGVAVLLSPQARAAWEAAGSVFQPASERTIKICLTCATCPTQLSCLFMLLLVIYVLYIPPF